MSELLKLYEEREPAPLEVEAPRDRDTGCSRCHLAAGAKNVCLPADGEPGGLLVVGDRPGKDDDAHKHVFHGMSGSKLRRAVSEFWKGPIAYDNALRCAGGGEVGAEEVAACRPFLAQTLKEAQPTRILAVGVLAAESVLGRRFTPVSTRRAYGWLTQGPKPVPVFLFHNPVMCSNAFLDKWYREDLEWALTCPDPALPPWDAVTQQVFTLEDAQAMDAELRRAEWFTYDVETSGKMFNNDFQLLSIAFCAKGTRNAWVIHYDDFPTVKGPVLKLLGDPRARKGGQNVKYDNNTMRSLYGVDVRGVVVDTRLLRKLLEPEAEANLDAMADLLGMGGHKAEAQQAMDSAKGTIRAEIRLGQPLRRRQMKSKNGQLELPAMNQVEAAEVALGKKVDHQSKLYAYLPRPILLRYNSRDAVVTTALAEHLERQLEGEPELSDIWEKVVIPAARSVEWMEFWGVGVSRPNIDMFAAHIESGMRQVQQRLNQYAMGFNAASVNQVRHLLFDQLGLTPTHWTDKGAPSTDEAALQELKLQGHQAPTDILEFRRYQKMQGFAAGKDGQAGLLAHIRDDGRIHPSINLDGTRSGRASCSDPNLQQIPSEKNDAVLGKMARDCFAAPPGYLLISADYSQLELRIAAMLSGDPEMKKIFEEDVDYHQRTAELISFVWGKKPEEVGKVERSGAKAFNFGILYGMSDEGIASRAGCTVEQATKIRQAIFGKMRKLEAWTRKCLMETTTSGVAWTWWDGQRARRRPLWRIAERGSDDYTRNIVSTAKHSSWNTPVQGTAAEFCTASAGSLVEAIVHEGLPAKLMLPIHDALLLQVKERDVNEVADAVRATMCGWPSLGVPLKVDIEVGPTWGSLTKLK